MLFVRIPIYENLSEEKLKAILPPSYYAKADGKVNKYNIYHFYDRDVVGTMEIDDFSITIGFMNITQADKAFVDSWSTMHPNHDPRSERWMRTFGNV